jgi:glycine transporter
MRVLVAIMDVPPGFDPTLILWLNLAGTFVFGISGGLAAARARLDFFGVIVLAAVVVWPAASRATC